MLGYGKMVAHFMVYIIFSMVIHMKGNLKMANNMAKVRGDLLSHLERRGIEVEISRPSAEGRAVGSFWIQFPNLLFPLVVMSLRLTRRTMKRGSSLS
jgi:hypothetical protein